MAFGGGFNTGRATSLGAAVARDFELPSPPADSISTVGFSPSGNQLFVAGSWDGNVRAWQLQRNMNTGPVIGAQPAAETKLQGPVLCSDFSPDGGMVFAGGCDKTVMMWNLGQAGSAPTQVAAHDHAVKWCKWIPGINVLATGSWDKTVKLWDPRSPQPTSTTTVPDRVYAMDALYPLLVVACGDANRTILAYDLSTGRPTEYARKMSPLKYQTRCLACWKDDSGQPGGFAVGSIEGRVGIEYINELTAGSANKGLTPTKKSFAFKCHRRDKQIVAGSKAQNQVFAVNDITFHPLGTFATAGSDGSFNFWDKDSRQRLKAFDKRDTAAGLQNSITTAAFSPCGELYAYALSYDWSKGYEHAIPNQPNAILIHQATGEEIKPRDKEKK